jgi:hypothetical protein
MLFVRGIISKQLGGTYPPTDEVRLPGDIFGPTSLVPGPGSSTEIFVRQADIRAAMDTIRKTLSDEAGGGRFLAGAIGVRVMAGTNAHLGMNQWPISCAIEMPSVHTTFTLALYDRLYAALDAKGIGFVCHWGQQHSMTPEHVQDSYGAKADAWRSARKELLSDTGQLVFGSQYLDDLGLST